MYSASLNFNAGMDIDDQPQVPNEPTGNNYNTGTIPMDAAAAAAAAIAATLARGLETRAAASMNPPVYSQPEQVLSNPSLKPSNLVLQCSNAKLAGNNVEVYSLNTATAASPLPVFKSEPATIPRIGTMFPDGHCDLSKLYHGARIMRGGVQTNEVLTSSFDPATLRCLSCPSIHPILNENSPNVMCFADQNFYAAVPSGSANGCLPIVRLEDASLNDLAGLAIEMLDKNSVQPGSVLLFGSATHLFRSGPSKYAIDWIELRNKLSAKFRGINICPLVPVIFTDCPGWFARDIEVITIWFHNVYNGSILGLLETWAYACGQVQFRSTGSTPLEKDDIRTHLMPKS
jgi:hypothetical protein